MKRVKIRRTILIVISLLVLGTAAAASIIVLFNKPAKSIPGEGIFFNVEEGESLSMIARRLEREGLIKSATYLIVLSKLMRTESLFQAGPYKIFLDLRRRIFTTCSPQGEGQGKRLRFLKDGP